MKNFPSAHIVLALLIVCALCYVPLRAQTLDSTKTDSVQKPSAQTLDSTKTDSVQKPRENWYWANIGLGLGVELFNPNRLFGIIVIPQIGISYAWLKSIVSANYSVTRTFTPFNEVSSSWNISALYGLISRSDNSFNTVSFGLAYGQHTYRRAVALYGGGDNVTTTAPGIVLEVHYVSLANLGIGKNVGIRFLANLNLVRPSLSAGFSYNFGYMP